MDLNKIYKDMGGNECNILQMVERSPEWAANIIQYYEKKIKALEQQGLPVHADL